MSGFGRRIWHGAQALAAVARRRWERLGWLLIAAAAVLGFVSDNVLAGELAGVAVGGLLWLTTLAIALDKRRERRTARTPAELAVGQRNVGAALYRVVGKGLIWAALLLLLLARPGVLPIVRTWLFTHPLVLFVLLLAGMALLTENNVIDWWFERNFRERYRRRDR